MKRINKLIADIERSGHGGLGKPEPLLFQGVPMRESPTIDIFRHGFGVDAAVVFYPPQYRHRRHACEIIGYAIVQRGILEHDRPRLQSYGLELSNTSDCTFAPSVADKWQGKGLGHLLLNFIVSDLLDGGFKRIILWGGVQSNNYNAVKFYLKKKF